MPMRDYEDLKNLKIPAEQERIMDIICDAWKECSATDCQSECKDNQVLPCEHILFACTALKYSRKIHEAGYAPVKWIDVNDRLPEPETPVLVRAEWTIEGKKKAWTVLAIREDGKTHEEDSSFAWDNLCEWGHYDEYTDSWIIPSGWWEVVLYNEMSAPINHHITHWMPLPSTEGLEHDT